MDVDHFVTKDVHSSFGQETFGLGNVRLQYVDPLLVTPQLALVSLSVRLAGMDRPLN